MADTQTLQSRQPKETLVSNYPLGGELGPRENRVVLGRAITNFQIPTPRLPETAVDQSLKLPRTIVMSAQEFTSPTVEEIFASDSSLTTAVVEGETNTQLGPERLNLQRRNRLPARLK